MRTQKIMHAIWMLANATQVLTHIVKDNDIWTIESAMECIEEAIETIKSL